MATTKNGSTCASSCADGTEEVDPVEGSGEIERKGKCLQGRGNGLPGKGIVDARSSSGIVEVACSG